MDKILLLLSSLSPPVHISYTSPIISSDSDLTGAAKSVIAKTDGHSSYGILL